MRMKAKVICNKKMYSDKLFATKNNYPICLGFHFHLEKYINKVFCFTFSYLKRWQMG